LLKERNFTDGPDATEPRGIQKEVLEAVNNQYYGRTKLKTNRTTVCEWVRRVRENNYQVTNCEQDYTQSSQNRRKFFDNEQQRIRDFIREEKLKSNEIGSVYSDKKKKQITVSATSARRIMKRPFRGEPSMVPSKPKKMKVGGRTAHHNKCRYIEAKFWKKQPQEIIDGIWFADESKMVFRVHKNSQIDIEWVFRGQASSANWHEAPRHSAQVNLFVMQSKEGIEFYDIYDENMTKARYKELLPQMKQVIDDSEASYSYYMHDNAWKGARPIDALNEYMGEGKWTQYMGSPCWIPSKTVRTPKTDKPARQHKKRCNCKFDPEIPWHAAYNPKMNLVENTFAELDKQMTKNMREDSTKGKSWIMHGAGKKRFWKRQLRRAIQQLNKTDIFENQYNGYKKRCDAFIKSRGKRIKNQKW